MTDTEQMNEIVVTPYALWKVRASRFLEQAQDLEREISDYMGPYPDYAREAAAEFENVVASLAQLVHAFDTEEDHDD